MADETKKKKAPVNPDSELSWSEMVKKTITAAQGIAKTLEPLGKVNRDDEKHEIKPINDTAGLLFQTARAVKTEFRVRQKKYNGGYDLGDKTASKAHTLRSKLEDAYYLALEIAADTKECEISNKELEDSYTKRNKPKIQAEAEKAKRAAARAAKKAADLEAQLKAS
jgi:hypothetical protein